MASEGLFVGRRDELDRFAVVLGELQVGWSAKAAARWRRLLRRGDPAGTAASRTVLVHGLGGSGKSRLLRRFEELASGKATDARVSPGRIGTVWLDWADEQRDQPNLYVAAEGPSLVTVLDAVQNAVIGAFDGDHQLGELARQAFDEYRQGAARMPEYAERFAQILAQERRPESAFTAEDAAILVKSAVSAGLTAGGHPGGLLGLTPDQLAGAAKAGGHLSVAATRALTGKKPGSLSAEEYALVTDPARELTRRTAAALRTVAVRKPLVILLDTGEVIGERAWIWLRRVMMHTGPRVVWVVGARFETEAEAGVDSPVAQFVRDIGDRSLLLMSPSRFDDAMIADYLKSRIGFGYSDEHVNLISQFTRGLPLALSFTAELLEGGEPVEEVCHEVDDGLPSSVVSRLARRYLVHAENQQLAADDPRAHDVERILGLALVFGDLRGDPDLLAALWGVPDGLTAFRELARRHDFVLPVSRRLHDDVRDTLRTDLLDPYRRSRTQAVNQRALALFDSRLATMRAKWPRLDDQLDHSEFTSAVLGKLWHTFWTDNQAGLGLFVELLPVLAVAAAATADTAVAIVDVFAETFDQDQRRVLDLLTDNRPDTALDLWIARRRAHLVRSGRTLKRVIDHRALNLPAGSTAPQVGDTPDRSVAMMILQARQLIGQDDQAAVTTLSAATEQTESTLLLRAVKVDAEAIARRLVWSGPNDYSAPTAVGLAAARIATEVLPAEASRWSWGTYAAALDDLHWHDQALTAFEQALTLEPFEYVTRTNMAGTLDLMGRRQDALAAYEQALAVNPDYKEALIGRAAVLAGLGRFEEAGAAADEIFARGVDGAGGEYAALLIHLGRFEEALDVFAGIFAQGPHDFADLGSYGNLLVQLGRFDEALVAFDEALVSSSGDAWVREALGVARALMGDLDRALIELDAAHSSAPHVAGEGRAWAGAIQWHRGDERAARECFREVVGKTYGSTAYCTAELEAIALCGLGQVEAAEERLTAALPLFGPCDGLESRALFALLTDPPLPAIDRLQALAQTVNGAAAADPGASHSS